MILSLDFDAFYCAVEEHFDPSLAGTPFIVYQKNIIATVSYPARALGLKKLGYVSEALKQFPDIRLVNGESLAKYRREGRRVYNYVVNNVVNGCPVERLGLEELWIDISGPVEATLKEVKNGVLTILGPNGQINDECPDDGVPVYSSEQLEPFLCHNFLFSIPGHVYPQDHSKDLPDFTNSDQMLRAYIASHIAEYVVDRIKLECGYTVSVGIATNKTLSKMACKLNKPAGLTLMVPGYEQHFLDSVPVRSIPYFKLSLNGDRGLTVKQAKQMFSKEQFMKTAEESGKGQEARERLWDLLHGIDSSAVSAAGQGPPKQLSIEDTYPKDSIKNITGISKALKAIVLSLFEKILDEHAVIDDNCHWIVKPTILRLSMRYSNEFYPSRTSVSTKVPFYLFELPTTSEEKKQYLADRIVDQLLKIFKYPRNGSSNSVTVRMLNVALTGFRSCQ
uniref:ARAD1A05632p n=1 Tax=Blastobotrys adeninivorans TaxID=409370 RepID=A0A060T313_BLAAD